MRPAVMRSHAVLAAFTALALAGAAVLAETAEPLWALPVLPVLAALLDGVRWTPLARLRVVQAGVIGQTTAVVAEVVHAPAAVTAAGVVLVGLAAVVTGYGVVKFRG
jgi:hypothetical protein